MKTIIFRTDSSYELGSGHLIRCRTLARALKKRGAKVIFISKKIKGNLIKTIEKEFKTYTIEPNSEFKLDSKEKNFYSKTLCSNQFEDFSKTLEIINIKLRTNIDWIIIDHYAIDEQWTKCIKKSKSRYLKESKIFIIDDLINRHFDADIILNQNFYGEYKNDLYNNLVPKGCRQFIGPKFALIGNEYKDLRKNFISRKKISRVLIFFGGVDRKNHTVNIIKQIIDINLPEIIFDVVIGEQNKNYEEIKTLIKKFKNFRLYVQINSLANLIFKSDLYIGSAGTTNWERACLGLPSIVKSISNDQNNIIKNLERAGLTEKFNLQNFKSIFKKYLSNDNLLETKSNLNFQLTEAVGADILSIILLGKETKLRIREISRIDKKLLLYWANDYKVRNNSFSKARITVEEHSIWFEKILSSKNKHQFIITDEFHLPIAQSRFDENSNNLIIDYSIDKLFRGNSLAEEVLKISFLKIYEKLGGSFKIIGKVKMNNIRSLKSFRSIKNGKEKFFEESGIYIFEFSFENKDFLNSLKR